MRAYRLKNSDRVKRYEAKYRKTHPAVLQLKEKRRAKRRVRVVKVGVRPSPQTHRLGAARVRPDGFVAIELDRELFCQLTEAAIARGMSPTVFVRQMIDRAIAATQLAQGREAAETRGGAEAFAAASCST